jgi:hypothetical protein
VYDVSRCCVGGALSLRLKRESISNFSAWTSLSLFTREHRDLFSSITSRAGFRLLSHAFTAPPSPQRSTAIRSTRLLTRKAHVVPQSDQAHPVSCTAILTTNKQFPFVCSGLDSMICTHHTQRYKCIKAQPTLMQTHSARGTGNQYIPSGEDQRHKRYRDHTHSAPDPPQDASADPGSQ